jgi:hypothetical protein
MFIVKCNLYLYITLNSNCSVFDSLFNLKGHYSGQIESNFFIDEDR